MKSKNNNPFDQFVLEQVNQVEYPFDEAVWSQISSDLDVDMPQSSWHGFILNNKFWLIVAILSAVIVMIGLLLFSKSGAADSSSIEKPVIEETLPIFVEEKANDIIELPETQDLNKSSEMNQNNVNTEEVKFMREHAVSPIQLTTIKPIRFEKDINFIVEDLDREKLLKEFEQRQEEKRKKYLAW